MNSATGHGKDVGPTLRKIGTGSDRCDLYRKFASVHAGSNSLDPEIVWAKVAALAEGAEIASVRA
ncbi:hypothetical protein WAB17_08970 [Parerythrobacter aurantius]|uniref:hypothetical protein n=1 Tax=Parerythrobacter aurantius TaxID=3127706 RepID=UPI00324B37D1